jgi:hypothetical protein
MIMLSWITKIKLRTNGIWGHVRYTPAWGAPCGWRAGEPPPPLSAAGSGRGELLRPATASSPLLRRGGHASQGPSSRQPGAELGDVAIVVRRCCNQCLQMLHECTRSCCNRFLDMFQSLSTYVCICVHVAVHDIGVRVCNRFLMSQLLFTNVVLVAYQCCIGFISM